MKICSTRKPEREKRSLCTEDNEGGGGNNRRRSENSIKENEKRKSEGPDDIPVEVWLILGDVEIGFLTKLMNNLLKGERMPDEWRKSVFIPIYKEKVILKNVETTEV